MRRFLLLLLLVNSFCQAQDALIWQKYTGVISDPSIPDLPDYSYAGYMRGEQAIPTTHGFPIFDVTDAAYGAIPNDTHSDQAAIQAAIDAAEANGSGVVFFPPGEYLVNTDSNNTTSITINSSNIVLKGSGSASGGTVINMVNYMRLPSGVSGSSNPSMITFDEMSGGSTPTSSGVGTANGGTTVISVTNASSFQNAKYCRIWMNPTTAANVDFLEGNTTKTIWTEINEGVFLDETHEIESVDLINNQLTLKDPLIDTFKVSYNWKVSTNLLLENCGFEDIHFKANFHDLFVHHQDYIHDYGWRGVDMKNVAHSWIRRSRFSNVSRAASISGRSYASSILNILVDGNAGHNISSVGFRSSRILQGLIWDNTNNGQFHGCDMSGGASGSVVWRIDARKGKGLDLHADMPRTNLIDLYTQVELDNQGGNFVNVPNHLKGLTMWNIERIGSSNESRDFWNLCESNYCGMTVVNPIVVGYHGNASTTFSNVKYEESNGTKVSPASLYEAQLSHRIGVSPTWVAQAQADWTSLRSQWSAAVSTDPLQCSGESCQVEITEIRTHGSDNHIYDYVELKGEPGSAIPSFTYLWSIGSGPSAGGASTRVNISNRVFPADGFMTIANSDYYSPDFEDVVNLWSFGNMSVVIVSGSYPAGDIDTDDDGLIDVVFWDELLGGVAVTENPADPGIPDYSSQFGIPALANIANPSAVYRHIIKDPITRKWRGNRENEGNNSETFGSINNAQISSVETLASDVIVNDLTIDPSASLTVRSRVTLEVLGDITNNGTLIFESGASLVETGASYAGNDIIFQRTVQHTNDALRHSLVGSPVAGLNLDDLGGQQYYQYIEANDTWMLESTNPTMTAGQGYSVVGKTDLQFSGVPNSGTLSVSATESAFKLLANPYPCAIDIEAFFNENTAGLTSETLRIWNDGGSENGQRQTSDYLTINSLGIAQSGNTGAKSKDSFIDNRVGAMQGFFVETSVSGSSIVFTDAMKVSDDNDDEGFFRSNDSDLQKVTIKLSNGSSFSEVLLGFIDGATDSFDPKYDALKLSDSGALQLDALVGDQPYTILSSPSLIGKDVILPFQFRAEAGSYTISADEYDLLPKDYFVYVFDKQLNSFHSLLEAAYEFTTSSVQTSDRFEIVLTRSSSPFTVTGLADLEPEIFVFGRLDGVDIKTTSTYRSADIFDLTGRVIESNLQLMEEAYGYRLDVSLTLDKIYIIRLDDTSVKFLFK